MHTFRDFEKTRLVCPECGALLWLVKSVPAGKKVKCPRCSRRFEPAAPDDTKRNRGPARAPGPGHKAPYAPRPEVPGYAILAELGQGGMGVVYKARQLSLNRLVALKMLLAGPLARARDISRFRTEALAVAQLGHPNVVQIYEVGESNGVPFLSLELVNGPTLAKRLAGVPQPGRHAAGLVEALARAIALAHQRGIIHRDLKPGNVLLAPLGSGHGEKMAEEQPYGTPKVADFGLAKLLDEGPGQTLSGAFVGTASYAAPEQARGMGQDVGPAADVYGLGAILYEMLTGRPPFRGADLLETLEQVTNAEVVPPGRLQPHVARDLEAICLKCLEKVPGRRYPDALALADDLRRFRDGVPTRARPPGPAERLRRWCLRYPLPAALLAVVTTCLAVGLWYLSHLTDRLVRSAALESVAQQADVLREVNDSYSDVVRRAQAGGLTVKHNYEDNPTAIPIPATFTIELGRQISERSDSGVQVRLYSDYPFRSRRNGGARDDFEREAWRRLQEDPALPVYRFEEYQGRPALRYATARQMQQACVDCHNSHPDSPKTDWRVGDVRGVVEIIRPLDRDAARTREGLQGAFAFVGGVCALLLALAGLVMLAGRFPRRRQAAPAPPH
jgi:serine/threonine protein kinase